ncbi:MAG TPA: hypothetical protein VES00_00915 [Burkholderiaceae bacterium]|jgi:hypothetical protein|nr:hypothetical protein [Burkholderiaceae bacterium]
MTNASRPTFLRNFGRGASSQRRPPDFADLGTAFGLDEAIESGSIDSVVPGDPNPPPLRAATPAAPWWLWLGRKLGA